MPHLFKNSRLVDGGRINSRAKILAFIHNREINCVHLFFLEPSWCWGLNMTRWSRGNVDLIWWLVACCLFFPSLETRLETQLWEWEAAPNAMWLTTSDENKKPASVSMQFYRVNVFNTLDPIKKVCMSLGWTRKLVKTTKLALLLLVLAKPYMPNWK